MDDLKKNDQKNDYSKDKNPNFSMRLRMKHGIEVIITQGKLIYHFFFIFFKKDADFYLITLQVCMSQNVDEKDEKKN